jgi:hypothetical protein
MEYRGLSWKSDTKEKSKQLFDGDTSMVLPVVFVMANSGRPESNAAFDRKIPDLLLTQVYREEMMYSVGTFGLNIGMDLNRTIEAASLETLRLFWHGSNIQDSCIVFEVAEVLLNVISPSKSALCTTALTTPLQNPISGRRRDIPVELSDIHDKVDFGSENRSADQSPRRKSWTCCWGPSGAPLCDQIAMNEATVIEMMMATKAIAATILVREDTALNNLPSRWVAPRSKRIEYG